MLIFSTTTYSNLSLSMENTRNGHLANGASADADAGVNLSMDLNRGRLNSTGNSISLPRSNRGQVEPADSLTAVTSGSTDAADGGNEMSTDELDVNMLFGAEAAAIDDDNDDDCHTSSVTQSR